MSATAELSVIICSHNSRADYFGLVLGALRRQTLPLPRWELLVIDNASQQPLAAWCDLSWHPGARHIREDELGLAVARQRGMHESATELLVFVDDDNVLEPDYLAASLQIGRHWPQLGVWGGSIIPQFEVEPPVRLRPFLSALALREVSLPAWSNVATCDAAEPWGAGLCVRAGVARAYCQQYRQSRIRLTDRAGRDLSSGGDTEICHVACQLGLGMGLFPELRVTHLIPRERLTDDYLVLATEGILTSLHVLAYKWRGTTPLSPLRPVTLLRLLQNLLHLAGIERRIYLARLRAAMRARSIIAAAQRPTSR